MRFREVFRYEVEYRLGSLSTGFYAAVLFVVMVWSLAATAGDNPGNLDCPHNIAEAAVLRGGLFGLLVSAALFGDAAVRDVAAGMDPLLYSTRLRKLEYLAGRLLATLAVNAILVLAIPIGSWIASASGSR